jgi:hypothetical protein
MIGKLSPTILRNLFLKVKPRDPRNLRVPLKAEPDQNNLSLVSLFLLHLPLLLGARGRGTTSMIPAPPNLLNWLPKNLHLKKRVPSTPTMTLAPLARESLYAYVFS